MRLLIIFFVFISSFCFSQELKELRMDYPKASSDEVVTNTLYETLSSISKENNTTTLVAYKGAVATLKAKFAKGIKNKKQYFEEGAELLEFAIKSEPNNLEIRCLRLGVQENSPKIVGYKQHIEVDKQFLLNNYNSGSDKEISEFIKGYVRVSELFTDAEKQLF